MLSRVFPSAPPAFRSSPNVLGSESPDTEVNARACEHWGEDQEASARAAR
jgi:hypothetical protein